MVKAYVQGKHRQPRQPDLISVPSDTSHTRRLGATYLVRLSHSGCAIRGAVNFVDDGHPVFKQ